MHAFQPSVCLTRTPPAFPRCLLVLLLLLLITLLTLTLPLLYLTLTLTHTLTLAGAINISPSCLEIKGTPRLPYELWQCAQAPTLPVRSYTSRATEEDGGGREADESQVVRVKQERRLPEANCEILP